MTNPSFAEPSSDAKPLADKTAPQAHYRKIASTGWISRLIPGVRSAVYVGDDHMLHAKQMVLFEKYRRFYFSDIEAISFSKSNRWIWFSVIWGFLLSCSLFCYMGHEIWYYVFGAIFNIAFGSLLASNLVGGPTYVVNIQTAAQIRRLRPVERENQLIIFQQIVVPMIMLAQQPATNQVAA
jgi:hypothetical protein